MKNKILIALKSETKFLSDKFLFIGYVISIIVIYGASTIVNLHPFIPIGLPSLLFTVYANCVNFGLLIHYMRSVNKNDSKYDTSKNKFVSRAIYFISVRSFLLLLLFAMIISIAYFDFEFPVTQSLLGLSIIFFLLLIVLIIFNFEIPKDYENDTLVKLIIPYKLRKYILQSI